MTDPFFHPVSGFDLPRFAGIPTFMRLPHVPPDHPRFAEVQIGLIGAPCDGGTTNRPGPGLPVAIPIEIALRQTGSILFAARSTGRGAHFQFIRRSAAKPIIARSKSASGLFSTSARRFIIWSVIGGPCGSGLASATRPWPENAGDHRSQNLHHAQRHDLALGGRGLPVRPKSARLGGAVVRGQEVRQGDAVLSPGYSRTELNTVRPDPVAGISRSSRKNAVNCDRLVSPDLR